MGSSNGRPPSCRPTASGPGLSSGKSATCWDWTDPIMYKKILVPTDGSEMCNKAGVEAAQLAKSLGASLLVMHVRSPIDVPHHVEGGALSRLGESKVMEEIEVEERGLLDAAVELSAANGGTGQAAIGA